MQYAIKHRSTGAAIITVEIECTEATSEAIKLGLAAKAANLRGANLEGANFGGANFGGANLGGTNFGGANFRGANLRGANLGGANFRGANFGGANLGGAYLRGANLEGANLEGANFRGANLKGAYLGGTLVSDIGQRSDGHQFFMQSRDDGPWIIAGCRYFSLADARKHWTETRGGTPLGDETNLMLDHAERIARHRGWLPAKEPV